MHQTNPLYRDQARKQALQWLRHRWPRVFDDEPVPLCLEANEQILEACRQDPQAPEVAAVKDALRAWVGSPAYLRRVAAGEPRHDLEGELVGPVAQEHRECAWACLEVRESALDGGERSADDSTVHFPGQEGCLRARCSTDD